MGQMPSRHAIVRSLAAVPKVAPVFEATDEIVVLCVAFGPLGNHRGKGTLALCPAFLFSKQWTSAAPNDTLGSPQV